MFVSVWEATTNVLIVLERNLFILFCFKTQSVVRVFYLVRGPQSAFHRGFVAKQM